MAMSSSPPPVVYGELSILGYNGYTPNVEKNGRRNRSKFLLCKRAVPNGIKKSRHYIVKQPQATKAIQDKDLHSISYTFSRSQTIIVEYKQDEFTDMFQIGRSSEDPIDFVVIDTLVTSADQSSSQHYNENKIVTSVGGGAAAGGGAAGGGGGGGDLIGLNRFHRHLAKVGEELLHFGVPAQSNHDYYHYQRNQPVVFLNYPQPNISNLPPLMADHFRHNQHNHGHSSQGNHQLLGSSRSNANPTNEDQTNEHHQRHQQQQQSSNRHNIVCKRSHATQSTISRFACRILVDRKPPYTARIYAAGFDSSKNIFLGEKATKWEQNNSIDGLTTNGVLLMHPKQTNFYQENAALDKTQDNNTSKDKEQEQQQQQQQSNIENDNGQQVEGDTSEHEDNKLNSINDQLKDDSKQSEQLQSNNHDSSVGGVWREVSVDGGIYAIRESRSAPQKGTRINNETNILQDGTLIDLCGATLLWRSVDGFKASPTKKSLEEKLDMLNASRPQCPVGLNTLVIPRKPIHPSRDHQSHHHHHSNNNNHHNHHHNHQRSQKEKSSHQPYVYQKCGHVQGYHDWGTTEKSNQRTCPICLSVGTVSKLIMGLEPSFYVDSGPLSHVFNPCGHMASEKTVNYWCSIKIPHGTHFFHSICPFCATPLALDESPSTRLIFQDDLD